MSSKKYGLEIAKSPRLCDAYLADLMPAYPEERKILVKAVAEGIPAQLLQNTTMRGHELAISHLVRNSMIPEQQARETVYVWSHALGREVQRIVQNRGRQARRSILEALLPDYWSWGLVQPSLCTRFHHFQ